MTEPETFTPIVGDYSIGDKQLYLAGVARGQKNEQKRIIKLIETEISRDGDPILVELDYLDGLAVALDLIKGETNE